MKRIPLWLPLLLAALSAGAAGAAGCQEQTQAAVSDPILRSPEAATQLELVDLNGQRWRIDEQSEGTYLVEFWATWCAPCRELRPKLNQLHRRYATEGLGLLAVTEEAKAVVSAYELRHPSSHRVLLDPQGEAAKAWKIRLLPTVLLVRSGRILGRWEGADSAPAIESALRGIYGR